MTQQLEKPVRPNWRFVAFVFVYAILLKVLPFVLSRYGMDVEKNFAIYPWNFTPIFAFCLFGGALYQSKWNAMWIPLAAMLAGDFGIWAVTGRLDWAFYPGQEVIYGAYAVCVLIGFILRSKKSSMRIAGAGLASCVSFFLITNFAVWIGSETYPRTFNGLLLCYVAGLPFLKNSLIATAIYGGILFHPVCLNAFGPAQEKAEVQPVASAS